MYYIVYAFLYAFSLLPFRVLYLISDVAYLILYYLVRYRRDVVMYNLSIAFPEKTAAERLVIAKAFYHNLLDNFIETIKLLSISRKTLDEHFICDFSVINNLHGKYARVQLHSGHFFNWEFANASYAMHSQYPLIVVYMPIKNKIFDKLFFKMRSRFGAVMIPATEFRGRFGAFVKKEYAMALVGDQNPGDPANAYWTDFFGRKTPFVKGPERGARLNDTAVVMCNFYKLKRGYYRSEIQLLTTNARSLPPGEVTREMVQFVTECIRRQPANYLWSHKRWKWPYDEAKHASLVI